MGTQRHNPRRTLGRDLREIAGRGRFLDEMLSSESAPSAGKTEKLARSRQAVQILRHWRFAFSRRDTDAFARRLRWDGLEADDVERAFGGSTAQPTSTLPPWIRPLEDVLGDSPPDPQSGDELVGRLLDAADARALPFAPVWIPFVRYGLRRLGSTVGSAAQLVSDEARMDLARQLLTQLARAAELALYKEFDALRQGGGEVAAPPPTSAPPEEPYRQFIDSLLGEGLISFFLRYSALARQVCTLVETWIATSAEMLGRLERDWREIQKQLHGGEPVGSLSGIRWQLSDRHHGGRRVLRLVFASGLNLMYKPRLLGLDVAYNGFLEWLGDKGLEMAPAPIRILPREGYGWIEFVPYCEAESVREAQDYYRKSGAMICLAYILNGSDLHMDNVVAGPDGPVLVDVESLLKPEPPEEPTSLRSDSLPELDERPSCLSSGLLTFPKLDPDGGIHDIGGFLGLGGHLATHHHREWKDVNTDDMTLQFATRTAEPQKNRLFVDGQAQPAESYALEISEGFLTTYRFLRHHRETIGAPDGPLSRFAGLPTRFLIRDSNAYAQALQSLLSPEFQKQGAHQGILVEMLNRSFSRRSSRPTVWPTVAEERRSLEGLDVPYFWAVTDELGLWSRDQELIPRFFVRSGFEVVRERLRRMDEPELQRQVRCLEAVLPLRRGARVSVDRGRPAESSAPPESDPCLRAAESIADEIREHLVEGAHGSRVLRAEGRGAEVAEDSLVDDYLYDGSAGIALFFAALAHFGRGSDPGRTAEDLTRPIKQRIEALAARSGPLLGACNGLGGLVYSLVSIGVLLGKEEPAEGALVAARLIGDEAIAADTRLDVEGGVAGAILGLLALHGMAGDRWVLERAVRCGQRLLAEATPAESGGAAWVGQDGVMRAGFAHGAAGIVYALGRLYEITGFDPFREAAGDGLRFERGVFDSKYKNWPVLVPDPEGGGTRAVFMNAWCHGAPGIALSRVGLLGILEDPHIKADLEIAIRTTAIAGLGDQDHLCCGNMGRIETQLQCALTLEDTEIARMAGGRAVTVLRRQINSGRFTLPPSETERDPFEPGFFRGLSGIGYELLRLSDCHRLPSVLIFEAPSRWKRS